MNGYLCKEDAQTNNALMKRCSTSLAITVMRLRPHSHQDGCKQERQNATGTGKVVENLDSLCISGTKAKWRPLCSTGWWFPQK